MITNPILRARPLAYARLFGKHGSWKPYRAHTLSHDQAAITFYGRRSLPPYTTGGCMPGYVRRSFWRSPPRSGQAVFSFDMDGGLIEFGWRIHVGDMVMTLYVREDWAE